ncbi:Hypothetical protein CINCED_3A006118 [Cinara cedri]|uniref:Uncharacterized protein n=1 Tax=Cinara cedri TaxID=506608 RepID=A0A5E4M8Q9_9HEMI|nr:Hypothetical protein CINCED_3A006118 [Cinara cedri]
MEFVLRLQLFALISATVGLCLVGVEAVPASRQQNTFVELDAKLLDRIELAIEEIARNSTKEFVEHEVQAMIDLFVHNLNITIDELQQYTGLRNTTDYDDMRMKELQKKGLIMYENTAITEEYVIYKIDVLTKSIEELEQLEKYIIDEEKRLKDLSDDSLQKKIKSVLEKIQTTKRFIGKHVDHLREVDDVLKGLGKNLMNTLKVSNWVLPSHKAK